MAIDIDNDGDNMSITSGGDNKIAWHEKYNSRMY